MRKTFSAGCGDKRQQDAFSTSTTRFKFHLPLNQDIESESTERTVSNSHTDHSENPFSNQTISMKSLLAYCLLSFVFLCVASISSQPPSLVVSDVTVDEAANVARIRLRLSEPTSNVSRVSWSTFRGNAISGKDYISRSGRATFQPGGTSCTVEVPIVDDDIDEPDQFFRLRFHNPVNLLLDENLRPKVVITDNDPEPTIGFRYSTQDVVEGDPDAASVINVAVLLSHRSEKNIRYTAYSAANTASELEFEPFAERMLFHGNGRLGTIPVSIVPDTDLEGRQQFYLYLRNPTNAKLRLSSEDAPDADRIRTKIRILDDDELEEIPAQIDRTSAFTWIGTFGRRFSANELATIAQNHSLVVIAKFHSSFDIFQHHLEAAALKQLNPELKVYLYFNSKYWFEASQWATEPQRNWLLQDETGNLISFDTDRSPAFFFDLRVPECRHWIIETIESWMATGLYDGIAFDSAGPVGDYGDDVFWLNALGDQNEVDRWNRGLKSLLNVARARRSIPSVLFNGIGGNRFRGPIRDLFQLEYTHGALHERFAVELDGTVSHTLRQDIDLMSIYPDKSLLFKTNLRDDGNSERNQRLGRFSFLAFMMGWQPGSSYFKFAIDDFYTTSELQDAPLLRQSDFGQPLSSYQQIEELLIREFQYGTIVVNPTSEDLYYQGQLVPAVDGIVILP